MTDNLRHWNVLGRTDPAHTKSFQRAGGFRGTATRPVWTEMRLTEHFGPCGVGWGCDEPVFNLVPAGEEILVFCTLRCWYVEEVGKPPASLYGVGGDKVLVKQQAGLRTDDEAYKKAFTDALGNAFKHVGAGADVHMGLFEDSKYVESLKREFAGDDARQADANRAGGAARPAIASPAPSPRASEPARPAGNDDPFAPQTPPTEHPRAEEARAAYKKIRDEYKAARLPRVIDDITKVHTDNIKLIKEISPDSYETLMSFATARKGEMLAAA